MRQIYPPDQLFLPPQQLAAFAKHHPTPFFLYDAAGLRREAQALRAAFAWAADSQHFYRLQANSNPAIVQLLHRAGLGVLVTSAAELQLALRCGAPPAQIVFHAPVIPEDALVQIRQSGCQIIFDSLSQVERFAAAGALPEAVGLCYNPGRRFKIDGVGVARPERSPAGMLEAELLQAAARLRACGVQRVGLHSQPASQILHEGYYAALAEALLALCQRLEAQTGVCPCYCDLSGGIGLGYEPGSHTPDVTRMAQNVRAVFAALPDGSALSHLPLRTQPGRLLTGRHGILVSRVAELRQRERPILLLDACAASLPACVWRGEYHHISILGKAQIQGRQVCDIAGMAPPCGDWFARGRLLPPAEPGDLCIIHMAGAYAQPTCSGRPCGEYLYEEDGSFRQIDRDKPV